MANRVVACAMTSLSHTGEGVFVVGRASVDLGNLVSKKLKLSEAAHLLVKSNEHNQTFINVYVQPLIGFDEVWVDLTSYTAYGYLTGELLEKYEAWSDAKKTGFPAVEEDEHLDNEASAS